MQPKSLKRKGTGHLSGEESGGMGTYTGCSTKIHRMRCWLLVILYLETVFLRRERLKEVIGWGTKATGQTKGSLSDCRKEMSREHNKDTPIYNPRRALTRNQSCWHPGLGVPVSEPVGEANSVCFVLALSAEGEPRTYFMMDLPPQPPFLLFLSHISW